MDCTRACIHAIVAELFKINKKNGWLLPYANQCGGVADDDGGYVALYQITCLSSASTSVVH